MQDYRRGKQGVPCVSKVHSQSKETFYATKSKRGECKQPEKNRGLKVKMIIFRHVAWLGQLKNHGDGIADAVVQIDLCLEITWQNSRSTESPDLFNSPFIFYMTLPVCHNKNMRGLNQIFQKVVVPHGLYCCTSPFGSIGCRMNFGWIKQ